MSRYTFTTILRKVVKLKANVKYSCHLTLFKKNVTIHSFTSIFTFANSQCLQKQFQTRSSAYTTILITKICKKFQSAEISYCCSYAYCSANLTKVILVLKWDEKPPKDTFIKSVNASGMEKYFDCFLQILYALYQNYLMITSNPFHIPGSELNEQDKAFLAKEIKSIDLINSQS